MLLKTARTFATVFLRAFLSAQPLARKADDQPAAHAQNARRWAGPHPAPVFLEHFVEPGMQLRFYRPVAAFGVEQPLRIELFGARAGDEITGFFYPPGAAADAGA